MMLAFALACVSVDDTDRYEPDTTVPHVDDESDADTDTDTDSDADTDTDTGTEPTEPVAWSGYYEFPDDGFALWADEQGDYVGMSVGVGDFDGDGANDVIAPAPYRSNYGQDFAGQVSVVLGPITADVDLSKPWVDIDSNRATGGFFGGTVAALPDGGHDALVVGEPCIEPVDGGGLSGITPAVYLFRDLAGGMIEPADADVIWTAGDELNELGVSLAVADFDADGTDDVLMGAPLYEDGFAWSGGGWNGIVFGVSGAAVETALEDAPLRINSALDQASVMFGMVMTNLGDVDGDGNDDIAVQSNTLVSVFHAPLEGDVLSTDADATVDTSSWGVWNYFRGSLSPAGDVDGDGRGDLLIGNPYESPDDDTFQAGAAWLINGSHLDEGATALDRADWTLAGTTENQAVGYKVATTGDIDGDGNADVLVSAPGDDQDDERGVVSFFQGPLSGTAEPAAADADFHGRTGAALGASLISAIDVTGDGLRDLVMGAPYASRINGGQESAVFIVPGIAL